ncbi:MAG TPA: hypothetical protein DHV51_02330, partial [Opitutae bacterium]|nr:hypothetical protein [Opitutae bacterium]
PYRFSLHGTSVHNGKTLYFIYDRVKRDIVCVKQLPARLDDRHIEVQTATTDSLQLYDFDKQQAYTLRLHEVPLEAIVTVGLERQGQQFLLDENHCQLTFHDKTYALEQIDFDKQQVLLKRCGEPMSVALTLMPQAK